MQEQTNEKHHTMCASVSAESRPMQISCTFAEVTAGAFLSTNVSFTYCITLGWIHVLHASSAAAISGGPCGPSYHNVARWQVSHTSQAGFYLADTAGSYCFFSTVHTL